MMRSLYSAVSGLKNHQTRLDVIGDNVANVNTIGFKKSTVHFKDQYSQTLSGASGPTNATGGANAKQVGLGVQLGSIDTQHTRGNIQYTGATWDMAIDGEGYFVVHDSNGVSHYTRAGNFKLNRDGTLIDASGNYVQVIGAKYTLNGTNVTFEPNTDTDNKPVPATMGMLTIPINAEPQLFSSMTVTSEGAIVGIANQDLDPAALPTGVVLQPPLTGTGTIPKGYSVVLGYVQIATFSNPGGLEKEGNNLYRTSDNSGSAQIATAGTGSRGAISPSAIEMSNVDLAEEMVSMIVTQRGFQANSRVITTSDAMLEELVNLKR